MADYTSEVIKAEPQFDLELFMTTSQETRIGADVMNRLSDSWDKWVSHAHAKKLTVNGASYLLTWLEVPVEEDVDDAWEDTPSEAFLYNALAQVMCMGMVHDLLPEVEDAGCAPAPVITKELEDALHAEGLPLLQPGEPGMERRYAVLTYFPYKGSCDVCSLSKNCPKGHAVKQGCSSDNIASITLPGYDRID